MSSPSMMTTRDSLSIDVVFEDDDAVEATDAAPPSTPTILAYLSAYPRVRASLPRLPAPPVLPALDTFEPRLPTSSIPLPLLRKPSAARWPARRNPPVGRWQQSEGERATVPAPRGYSRAA
jgi:hypothetical protein